MWNQGSEAWDWGSKLWDQGTEAEICPSITISELLKKISNPNIMILQGKQLQSRKFEPATQP